MAEKVVKGPGPKGPVGPKPKIKNPGKLFMRLLKYVMQKYTLHCVIELFCNVVSELHTVQ